MGGGGGGGRQWLLGWRAAVFGGRWMGSGQWVRRRQKIKDKKMDYKKKKIRIQERKRNI